MLTKEKRLLNAIKKIYKTITGKDSKSNDVTTVVEGIADNYTGDSGGSSGNIEFVEMTLKSKDVESPTKTYVFQLSKTYIEIVNLLENNKEVFIELKPLLDEDYNVTTYGAFVKVTEALTEDDTNYLIPIVFYVGDSNAFITNPIIISNGNEYIYQFR